MVARTSCSSSRLRRARIASRSRTDEGPPRSTREAPPDHSHARQSTEPRNRSPSAVQGVASDVQSTTEGPIRREDNPSQASARVCRSSSVGHPRHLWMSALSNLVGVVVLQRPLPTRQLSLRPVQAIPASHCRPRRWIICHAEVPRRRVR